jgi:hypothetical protein
LPLNGCACHQSPPGGACHDQFEVTLAIMSIAEQLDRPGYRCRAGLPLPASIGSMDRPVIGCLLVSVGASLARPYPRSRRSAPGHPPVQYALQPWRRMARASG